MAGIFDRMAGASGADETELTELTNSVLKKLRAMTDDEYAALADTLIPDYEEEQEE